jgi:hypothetical protein
MPEDDPEPVFAFRGSAALKLISGLAAGRKLANALRAALPFVVDPAMPPNHPARQIESEGLEALIEWRNAAEK